jgi:hypothetical protein
MTPVYFLLAAIALGTIASTVIWMTHRHKHAPVSSVDDFAQRMAALAPPRPLPGQPDSPQPPSSPQPQQAPPRQTDLPQQTSNEDD